VHVAIYIGVRRRLVVSCGEQQCQVPGVPGVDGRVKGLSGKDFAADSPDGRGRLAPFPLAGRAGGWMAAGGSYVTVTFHTKLQPCSRWQAVGAGEVCA